jgi:4-amino-4-deoxy-L-arabinose transferase-like glycosyltransferase
MAGAGAALERASSWLCRLELGVARGLLLVGLLVAPYYNVRLPGGGVFGALGLLVAGVLLAIWLPEVTRSVFAVRIAGFADRLSVVELVVFGLGVQFLSAVAIDAVPTSDALTYLELAQRLSNGATYVDASGNHAFWPPGMPLYLAPFLAVLEHAKFAVIVANLLLYLVSAISIRSIASRLGNEQSAKLAVLLFTLWPNRLLVSGLAAKEYLALAALLAGIALCMRALSTRGRSAWCASVAAGVGFGLASLTQPGLMLLIAALPLMFRGWRDRASLGMLVARLAAVGISAAMVIAPWQVRNCAVFHGQFCGLSTNGGSVFYRANNPRATGLWIAEGEIPITHLPELEQNRLGYELGKKWIAAHPWSFLKLSGHKLIQFLGDDDYGAQFAVLMGRGERYERALATAQRDRLIAFHAASAISLAYWLLLLGCCAYALGIARLLPLAQRERLIPLVYPLLYSAVVFSVFESGSRQHTVCAGLLIAIIAIPFATRTHPLHGEVNSRAAPARRSLELDGVPRA